MAFTRQELMTALRNADKSGDNAAAQRIAKMVQTQDQQGPSLEEQYSLVPQSLRDTQRVVMDSMTRGLGDKLEGDDDTGANAGGARAPARLGRGSRRYHRCGDRLALSHRQCRYRRARWCR